MGDQLAPQRPPRLDQERQVDRLVGDLHVRLVWILHLEPPRDLLRRPVQGKLASDQLTQHAASPELAGLGTPGSVPKRARLPGWPDSGPVRHCGRSRG